MQFLYPSFLWALLCLAIPVLIHLFYFRRFKRIYFTNVRFLKEIKEETSNRNRLKNLLVLLMRLFVVACLVVAFAQPFLPRGADVRSGIRHVSVFVDNSFSMTAANDDIPLLDLAKEKARQVVNAYNDDDKFQILTHDFEGRHQRFVTKEDALAFIEDIKSTPAVQKVDRVLQRQLQLLRMGESNRISYVISDFQKSITDLQSYADTTVDVNLMPVQAEVRRNVFVDSVWFDGPKPLVNQNNRLIVRIKNGSPEEVADVTLFLKKGGQDKPLGIVTIPGNGSVLDTVIIKESTSGWQQATVAIGDYPVQFDDEYYISYFVPDTIRTLHIYDQSPNRYLASAIRGLPNFTVIQQQSGQLQYQSFRTYDLIVLDDVSSISTGLSGELSQYVRDGGRVLLFPGPTASVTTLNAFLTVCNAGRLGNAVKARKEVNLINTDAFVFSDVYITSRQNMTLPVTQLSYPLAAGATVNQENLLVYRDGAAYLASYKVGEGQLYVFTAPLSQDWNDVALQAEIFVPMLFKMAISTTRPSPLAYFIGNQTIVEADKPVRSGDFVFKITNGKDEFIPTLVPAGNKVLLDLGGQVQTAGQYNVLLESPVGSVALNYNRLESDMSIYSASDLEGLHPSNPKVNVLEPALQANIGGTISEKDRGIPLWKWFVLGALIFLALETILIRYYRT